MDRISQFFNFPNAALLLICGAWFGLATFANLDLSHARYVLPIDEKYLAFDWVAQVLHSKTLSETWDALVARNDTLANQYGRTFVYAGAAAAFLPERIFGDVGQIVAFRVLESLLLLGSFLLLVHYWIGNLWLRVLCLTLLVSLPTTRFFAAMPKPEPIQMLFLALFVSALLAKQRVAGGSWILFGLAYGTKINVVVLAPIALLFAAMTLRAEGRSWRVTFRELAISFGYFALGLAAAVPILLYGIEGFETYWRATFGYIENNKWDDPAIGLAAWMMFYLGRAFSGRPWATFLITMALVLPIVLLARQLLRAGDKGDKHDPAWLRNAAPIFLAAMAFFLLASVMAGAHRLWEHYLFPGVVLLVVAGVAALDSLLKVKRSAVLPFAGVCIIVLCASALAMARSTAVTFLEWGKRTASPHYIALEQEHHFVLEALEKVGLPKGRRLRIITDPEYFAPDGNANWKIEKFSGAFFGWEEGYDVILMHKGRMTVEDEAWMSSPQMRSDYKRAMKLYPLHVRPHSESGSTCIQSPCYREFVVAGGNIRMLVRDGIPVK